MTLQAAFIGLGAMGAPMAGHLKARGLLHAVGNRTQSRADALARELGVVAPSLPELAAQCDVIALCVTADADVLANVDALAPHLKKGAIVIDHSTVAPSTAKAAAAKLQAVGAYFLDAPVSGGVEGARNGKLSVMVGGDAEVLERARPVLEAYALRVTHLGDIGAGQATKAVNQVLVAGIAQAVCEGLALGEALGLDPERLIPTLGAGAAGNWFLEKRGATMLRNEFSVGFKLGLLHKDLGIVRKIATEAGTDRSVIERSLSDYADLMSQGYGDDDISGLIRLKRKQ
ncbi:MULTISPECIES: NAD(P)-dependent oxidoreductase [Dyella]|uniref:NAD(P)-dependent oxidoreductase n=2 Tax=Dyella TaxID=231454 RepID=A0A4R0YJL3_9GAMM|nr:MULTISPECIES: NAD(P)-dependent oxidoreductase [Dyella]TBR35790.1 NAD(P)-dependent oxidoreductase [Dyella terrae]TCI08662.1 NAD(P)-dependent oxidoreductase [Dyella soli]